MLGRRDRRDGRDTTGLVDETDTRGQLGRQLAGLTARADAVHASFAGRRRELERDEARLSQELLAVRQLLATTAAEETAALRLIEQDRDAVTERLRATAPDLTECRLLVERELLAANAAVQTIWPHPASRRVFGPEARPLWSNVDEWRARRDALGILLSWLATEAPLLPRSFADLRAEFLERLAACPVIPAPPAELPTGGGADEGPRGGRGRVF